MGDVFKEQIVKRLPTSIDRMKKICLIAAAAMLSVILLGMPIAAPIGSFSLLIVFAIWFGVYYFLSFLKVEYEYSFTNGSLDIDVIYAKSRRKRLFTGDVKDFEIMSRTDSKEKMAEFSRAEVTLDYSSHSPDALTYAFLTRHKGRIIKIIIQPNDMMLQAFATVLSPRKFFR
jgi:hypothetical protein